MILRNDKAGGMPLHDFKPYYKVTIIETEHTDQWDRIENQEINPFIFDQLIFDKKPRIYYGERIVSSINGAAKTVYPHVKE